MNLQNLKESEIISEQILTISSLNLLCILVLLKEENYRNLII